MEGLKGVTTHTLNQDKYFFLTSQNGIYITPTESPWKHKVCQQGPKKFTNSSDETKWNQKISWYPNK